MNPRALAALAALALLLVPASGSALTSDRDQPIHIEADHVQIDDAAGVSVYTGNVVYTQGTIRLEADTVRLYYAREARERKVDRLEAEGAPARFRQRLEGQDGEVRAEALNMEYHTEPPRLVLSRKAHVWRLNAEFSGDVIEYDGARDRVSAAGAPNGGGRVQVTIQPEEGGADAAPR
jgi:lipopolysaccharide export system protein LptA